MIKQFLLALRSVFSIGAPASVAIAPYPSKANCVLPMIISKRLSTEAVIGNLTCNCSACRAMQLRQKQTLRRSR
jgi:hypothetical protein